MQTPTKNNFKIIHLVLGKANPERMNGVNKVANELATTQTKLGFDVELWGIANDLEHNYPERNYKTLLYQQLSGGFKIDENLTKAIDDVDATVSVFHLHGAFIPQFSTIGKKLRKLGIPYVYTPHGALTEGAMSKGNLKKRVYLETIEKFLIKGAKAIQLLGHSEYENLTKMISTKNKVIIANGQNLNELPINLEKGEMHPFPIFMFCGRIDKYHKGLDLLFEGFKIFKDNGGNGTIQLIGGGKDEAFLKSLADRLGISEKITFHGPKFGKEKFNILLDGDLFVHTSRMEGFPTAVLEAAGLSMPCLVTRPTNMDEYIETYDAGFVVKENTPEKIAEQLARAEAFHHYNLLGLKGRNARRMVEDVFTWEEISKQLISVYAEKDIKELASYVD